MCGIALIISGIKIDLSLLLPDYTCPSAQHQDPPLALVEDIKAALQRRGPDSLGVRIVNLHSEVSYDKLKDFVVQSFVQKEGVTENGFVSEFRGELLFIGATLQLRGVNPVLQPLIDAFGNVLVYNGEIFGGIQIRSVSNDTQIFMQSLGQCCSCLSHDNGGSYACSEVNKLSVPELLSKIRGPWAVIYWQDSSKTLWFGRDAFGRRSLLVHWPTLDDSRLLLSSVTPHSSTKKCHDNEEENGKTRLDFWEELSCGVYSVSVSPLQMGGYLLGEVKKHAWTDFELKELISWERTGIEPEPENLSLPCSKYAWRQQDTLLNESGVFQDMRQAKPPCSLLIYFFHAFHFEFIFSSLLSFFLSQILHLIFEYIQFIATGCVQSAPLTTACKVLKALTESVRRRTSLNRIYEAFVRNSEQAIFAPIAVLFSGGLDSMIIAALLHMCIDSEYEIDLLNVSFDGESAPDRVSAKAGLKELQNIATSRKWNLVEIDADLQKLTSESKHVMALIDPAKTYMDLNIGIALWLAAGGDGWLHEDTSSSDGVQSQRVKYKSVARILLVGSGADEQCAGYGRHRTKFRSKSWLGLHEEMKLDMQRIWKRNLGRDDRCLSDNGKEARFPFLDEDVIRTLLDIPLWEIADLNQPSGVGDKKILREVARLLGLNEVARLPKRAIQFGSRIARESNRKNFGSNRAANQASAGSVVINRSSN